MLKKLELGCHLPRFSGFGKRLALAPAGLLLIISLSCNSVLQPRQAAMIRAEVEKNSSFPTKWNGLEVAVANGNTELWASDFVQGNVRNRVLWIVWKDGGRIEIHPYPTEGQFFVEEAFGQHRPEVLGQALPLANKYLELLHRMSSKIP